MQESKSSAVLVHPRHHVTSESGTCLQVLLKPYAIWGSPDNPALAKAPTANPPPQYVYGALDFQILVRFKSCLCHCTCISPVHTCPLHHTLDLPACLLHLVAECHHDQHL